MSKKTKLIIGLGGILLFLIGMTQCPLSHSQPSIPNQKARSLELCGLLASRLAERGDSETPDFADLPSEDWPFGVHDFVSRAPEQRRHRRIEDGYIFVVESYAEENPQFLSGFSAYWVLELSANRFAVCERFDIWGDSIGVAVVSRVNEEPTVTTFRMPVRKFCEWLKVQLLEEEQEVE